MVSARAGLLLSKVAFPPSSSRPDPPQNSIILSVYVLAGTVVGLVLPIAYIFHGIVEGDKEGIKAAAPHVFLLASQIFMEGLSFSTIPCGFLAYWSEMAETTVYRGSSRRLYVGKALAFINMAFWSFNLFAFLLPFYLPKALKMYYAKIKD